MAGRLRRLLRHRLAQGADHGGAVPGVGRPRDGGSSAIEFVVLTPVMFFMIFGAVQFAMYSFADHVATAAAQAGARTARAEADVDAGGWRDKARAKSLEYVEQLGPGLFVGTPTVRPVDMGGDVVRVVVEGRIPMILPGMDMTVTATSEGPVERFVPDGG